MAIVRQGDDLSIYDFYEEVIGFKRHNEVHISYEPGYMPSDMFELSRGETFSEVDFDDPEAGDDPTEHLPGRLRCFNLRSNKIADDRLALAQPGNLGHSLYTVRVGDLEEMHGKVTVSHATDVTSITLDEFGTKAFTFVAPDGFTWTVTQYTD